MPRYTHTAILLTALIVMSSACSSSKTIEPAPKEEKPAAQKPALTPDEQLKVDPNVSTPTLKADASVLPANAKVPATLSITGKSEGVEDGAKVLALWAVNTPKGVDYHVYGSGSVSKNTFTLTFPKSEVPEAMLNASKDHTIGKGFVIAYGKNARLFAPNGHVMPPSTIKNASAITGSYGLVFAKKGAKNYKRIKATLPQDQMVCVMGLDRRSMGPTIVGVVKPNIRPIDCGMLTLRPKLNDKAPLWTTDK